MKISVFGLGYVGVVTAACFAKLGHEVIGVDLVQYKVESINGGEAPIKEKGLDELVYMGVKSEKLKAMMDTEKAILETDISFICVGTPPKRKGDIDLEALKRVCEEIGKALRKKKYHLIVIRSTMFPGSFEIVKEILEKSSNKKSGKDFNITANPEFLREGTAIKDFFNPPFIIIGSENKDIAKKIIYLYKNINTKKFIVKPDIAQMIKYVSNSWHALKVTFANEIGAICSELGIDSKNLMGLFLEDNQLNISPYYLKPGFAYGGSCLPKDLAALQRNSFKLKVHSPILDSISKSNFEQMKRAIKLIESTKNKKIGILGITFKADTDDLRGNPMLFVINNLLNKGYEVKIFDPIVGKANLKNISRSYRKEVFDLINKQDLKEKVADISKLFCQLDELLKQDTIIFSNRDKSLQKYAEGLSEKQTIIDLQKVFDKNKIKARYLTT